MRPPSSWAARAAAGGAVLVALAVATGASAAPAAAQVGRIEVAAVEFEGNRTFPDDSLSRAIVTRGTRCRSWVFQVTLLCPFGAEFAISEAYLPRRELPRDQLRLRIWYQRRGFREAQVDTATTLLPDGRARVTFTIHEGEPVVVDTVVIFGAEDFEGTDLLDDLPLSAGDRLSTLVLDATRDTIVARLANRGYAHAEVLRSWFIPNDARTAEVTYDVAAGVRARYGHVAVQGNRNLSEFTVLRTLQFRTGDVYRRDQIREAQARLFGLEIIRNASVVPDLESRPDSVVPVSVEVAEGDLHRVRGGGGWTNAECLNVEGRWTSRNFLGGGRRLQVRGRVSNILAAQYKDILCWEAGEEEFGRLTWLASVDLNQPWIFSTRNSLQGTLFAERQSLPDIFVREAVGFSMALTRAIGPRTPLTAFYRPELTRLDAAEVQFCTSFLVCRPEDVQVLRGANWLAPVGLTFSRTTTNNVLNPSRGYTTLIDLEHAAPWTGSNFRYDRLVVEGTAFTRSASGGVVLGARGRVGWVGAGAFEEILGRTGQEVDVIHPQKRFYAGGANSVRGFAQNRLGPRVLTLPPRNVSLLLSDEGAGCLPLDLILLECDASGVPPGQFVPRPTGGAAVVEGSLEARIPVGGRFQLAGFADFGQMWQGGGADSPPMEVTPGFGVRYLSPIGPLRLDIAYRFRSGDLLQVVTNQIRPYDPAVDRESDRIRVDGAPIPYVRLEDLAFLRPLVRFGDSSAGSLSRFQIHLSLGQAF